MRELSIPTRKTNPIHNDVLENTIILHIDQLKRDSTTKRKIDYLGSFLSSNRTNRDRIRPILEMSFQIFLNVNVSTIHRM